jgi:glycosyltransferase involved in cell wall biosynthesis
MVLDHTPDSGHQLELVFFQDGPWPDALRNAGFRVEVIPTGRLRQPHRMAAAVAQLAGLFHRRQPDLILNWSTKTHLYGSAAAMLVGMTDRVAWWQHGIPRDAWLDRAATALPAIAVGCCSQAAARAQRRLRPSRPTFVVPPGSPLPIADREPVVLALPEDVPIIGLVGRLQPWKGQDRLLKALALLRRQGHGLHALIVGGDAYGLSAEYAQSLPLLIKSLELDDAVTMTDQVPDAGPYIDRMDILVNASESEPFGIVLLEGMARKVPVVAVDSGGPAEFIEHGKTGMLAESGEPESLAGALEPLLTSADLRRSMADAAEQKYRQEFTDAAMCRNFFDQLDLLAKG